MAAKEPAVFSALLEPLNAKALNRRTLLKQLASTAIAVPAMAVPYLSSPPLSSDLPSKSKPPVMTKIKQYMVYSQWVPRHFPISTPRAAVVT